MARMVSSIAFVTLVATSTHGFAPVNSSSRKRPLALRPASSTLAPPLHSTVIDQNQLPFFLDFVEQPVPIKMEPVLKKAVPKPKAGGAHNQEGIFSPFVVAAKKVIGDEKLNKVRAKVISMHSDVITNFVETSDTRVGSAVLKNLFELADANKNGKIEQDELATALQALGFSWLQNKQTQGIFQRADLDADGAIDLKEFMKEAPKTLRTNLIKLAKKNGGELGFLA